MNNNFSEFTNLKVAFAHYWFVEWGGGERLAKAILDLFPNADIYTLFYNKDICGSYLKGHRVFTSCLDNKYTRKYYQHQFPLYPMGVGSLELQGDYDLLISSESGPIKGIANPNNVPHLCYIHTPMRYCWGYTDYYLEALPVIARPFAKMAFESLRRYDETTINAVTRYTTNSENVRQRVQKYYHRDADVIFGPISLDLFDPVNLADSKSTSRDYYLSFGRITPYKGVGLLVDTFNENGKNLVVIGEGSERKKIESRAKSNIKFLGKLPFHEIQSYIRGAKALIFPGDEDLGLVPLEVMAHGVPVIAYGRGGALETVKQNLEKNAEGSGLFFDEQSVACLQATLDYFEKIQDDFDPKYIQSHARGFGEDVFKEKFLSQVRTLLS